MSLNADLIADCTDEYHKSVDRLAKLVLIVVERLEAELRRHKILARVSGRVKTRDSLSKKLLKWTGSPDKVAAFSNKHDVFAAVGDLAAVRVMTYIEQDRERVAEIVKEIFSCRLGHGNFELEIKENTPRIKSDESNYYRATHMQIALRKEDLSGDNRSNLKDDHCELQITSMLAHVWNEIEHDIGYKGDKSSLSNDEVSALESLGLLTKSGDNIIVSLINATVRREKEAQTKTAHASQIISDSSSLSNSLLEYYGSVVGGKTIDYWQNNEPLLRALSHLNLLHPSDIFRELTPSLLTQTANVTIPHFKKFLVKNSMAKPGLAPQTCDLFLMALISKYPTNMTKQVHVGYGPKPRQLAFAIRYERYLSSSK